MEFVLALMQTALTIVFALSSFTKARSIQDSVGSAVSLGAPSRLAKPLMCVLIGLEAAIAVGLLFRVTSLFAGITAFIISSAYALVLARNLRKGNRPTCHCFGALDGSRPISWWTAVRAFILVLVSAISVIWSLTAGAVGISPLFDVDLSLSRVEWAIWIVLLFILIWLVVLTAIQLSVLRRIGLGLSDVEEAATEDDAVALDVGQRLPSARALKRDGEATLLPKLQSGATVVYIAVHSSCTSCHNIVRFVDPQVEHFARKGIEMVILVDGESAANQAVLSLGPNLEAYTYDDDLRHQWGVVGSPTTFIANPEGELVIPPATGTEAFFELIESIEA